MYVSHCSCFLSTSRKTSGYKVAFDCWTVRKTQPSQRLVVGVIRQVLKGFPFIPLKTVCSSSLRPLFEGMLSSSGRRLSTYTNLLSLRREKGGCVCCATVADEDVWLTWFHERETLIWGVNTRTALCGWGNRTQTKCAFDQRAAALFVPKVKNTSKHQNSCVKLNAPRMDCYKVMDLLLRSCYTATTLCVTVYVNLSHAQSLGRIHFPAVCHKWLLESHQTASMR